MSRVLHARYTSIFGMRMGISLVAITTFISVMVRLTVLFLLMMAT